MHAKEGFVAVFLGFLAPGAGHVYLGRLSRFLVALAVFIALLSILAVLGLLSSLAGFVACAVAALALFLFSVVDSLAIGLRSGHTAGRWYVRWPAITGWVIVAFVVVQLWLGFREPVLGYATFRVPGTSMEPTLTPGDVVLVDTRAPSREVLRADTVVVVKHPATGALYIRRLQGQSDAASISVRSESPTSPEADAPFQSMPRESITGVVTSVLWSPLRQRIAFAVQ